MLHFNLTRNSRVLKLHTKNKRRKEQTKKTPKKTLLSMQYRAKLLDDAKEKYKLLNF